MKELGDPKGLSRGERHYVFLPLWMGRDGGKAPSAHMYCDRTALAQKEIDKRASYRFRLCEDRGAGGVKGSLLFRATRLLSDDETRVDASWQRKS